jgi:hypothetical protein
MRWGCEGLSARIGGRAGIPAEAVDEEAGLHQAVGQQLTGEDVQFLRPGRRSAAARERQDTDEGECELSEIAHCPWLLREWEWRKGRRCL